ncbi:MAG: aminotransferase class IV [Bacillota bacterium]
MEFGKDIKVGNTVYTDDFGFLHGFSLFETFLVNRHGGVFLLDNHIDRLFNSMNHFDFKIGFTKEDFKGFVLDYIKDNGIVNRIMRVTVSYGNSLKGINSQVHINLREYCLTPDDYKKGYRLKVSDVRKSEYSYVIRHKTANYIENYLIAQKALKDGFQDAILLNSKENITETTRCNLFSVKGSIIYTPAVKCGLLPGIIRDWVIEKAKDSKIQVLEGEYHIHDLLEADEVFVTNSVIGIMGVYGIEDKTFKQRCKKSITDLLQDGYMGEAQGSFQY